MLIPVRRQISLLVADALGLANVVFVEHVGCLPAQVDGFAPIEAMPVLEASVLAILRRVGKARGDPSICP
jgi:hypothetical protein